MAEHGERASDTDRPAIDALAEEGRQLLSAVTDLIERLRDVLARVEAGQRQDAPLAERIAKVEQENAALRQELSRQPTPADESDAQHDIVERYRHIEEQNANLINLYAASYELHSSLNYGQVLQTIVEILVNLIGAEKVGVYRLEDGKNELRLIASEGLDERLFGSAAIPPGVIRREVIEEGRAFFSASDQSLGETHPLAVIPMKVRSQISGIICVFKLLFQKKEFSSMDHELFEMLADHAAIALYRTALLQRYADPEDLEDLSDSDLLAKIVLT